MCLQLCRQQILVSRASIIPKQHRPTTRLYHVMRIGSSISRNPAIPHNTNWLCATGTFSRRSATDASRAHGLASSLHHYQVRASQLSPRLVQKEARFTVAREKQQPCACRWGVFTASSGRRRPDQAPSPSGTSPCEVTGRGFRRGLYGVFTVCKSTYCRYEAYVKGGSSVM